MPLLRLPMSAAPSRAPRIVPRPPARLVPPMIAAVMASSSRNRPALPETAPLTRAVKATPVMPYAKPAMTKSQKMARPTFTPASRAASGLPPMA